MSLPKQVESAMRQLSGANREAVESTIVRYKSAAERARERLEETESIPGQIVEDGQYFAGAALRGLLERGLEYGEVLDFVGPGLKFIAPAAWGASAATGIRPVARLAVGFGMCDVRDAFAGEKATRINYSSAFLAEIKAAKQPNGNTEAKAAA